MGKVILYLMLKAVFLLILLFFLGCSRSITVSFSNSGITVNETGGGTVTVTLNLSQNPKHKLFEPGVENPGTSRDVIVPFTVSGSTDYEEDHNLLNGSVTIKEGELSTSLSFNYFDDELDEEDETIIVSLGNPNNGVQIGEYGTFTVTILDDDVPPRISFALSSSSVNEESLSTLVTISLNNPSGRILTVPFTFSGSAERNIDFSAEDYLVIPKKTTSIDFPITITDDIFDEEAETVEITMGTVENAVLGSPYTHTITINDNDTPSTVNFASDSQIVSEAASSVSVLVGLNRASGLDITVPYTVTGTATPEIDHALASSGNVIIPKGSTSTTITFNIVDDSLDEDDETVIITMGSPVNATKGSTSITTITITDNDPLPQVRFTSATSGAVEPSRATSFLSTITVELTTKSGRDVSVPYTVSGTSTYNDDHDLSSGTLTITAGNTTNNINFNVKSDDIYEGDETIIVSLSSPTNAELGTPSSHTVTIVDADSPPKVCFTIGPNLNESLNKQNIIAWFVGSAKSAFTTTVGFSLSTTGLSNPATICEASCSSCDIVADNPKEVVISPGYTDGTSQIFTACKDGVTESDEYFNVIMSDIANAVKGTTVDCGNSKDYVYTVKINANSTRNFSFSTSSTVVSEWSKKIKIKASLNESSENDIDIPFELKGEGIAEAKNFHVKKGDLHSVAVIEILDDLEEVFAKEIQLTLKKTSDIGLRKPLKHTITVLDNDWQKKISGFSLWLNTEKNLKTELNYISAWSDLLDEEKEFIAIENRPHLIFDENTPFGFVEFKDQTERLFSQAPLSLKTSTILYIAAKKNFEPYISVILNNTKSLFDDYMETFLSGFAWLGFLYKSVIYDGEILRCQEKNNEQILNSAIIRFKNELFSKNKLYPSKKLGEISELMVFDKPLLDTEHNKILKYLLLKHSISPKKCKNLVK